MEERSSITKSGQIGAKEAFCSSVKVFQRSSLIHDASGERIAPLGKVKPVLESNVSPVPSFSAQFASY